MVFASFARRMFAALLDSAVWVIGIALYISPLAAPVAGTGQLGAVLVTLAIFTAWFNYFAITEWRYGQTIGKNALGLRVVPVDAGARLTYNAAAMRNLLRIVDLPLALIGVDWLIVDRSPRNQRLGDRAAHTVVLREPQDVAATPPPATPEIPAQPAAPAPRPTSGELFGDATRALNPEPRPPAPPPGPVSEPASGPGPEPGFAPLSDPHGDPSFPYSNWGPKVAVVGVIVAVIGGALLGIPAILIDNPPSSGDLSTGANVFVQLMTVAAFFAVPVFVAARGGASAPAVLGRLGVRRFGPSAIGWMFVAAFVYLALAAIYAALVTQPKQEDIASSFGPLWIQLLLIVVLAATSEELCFRGMLFSGIRERLPSFAAALISGAIFGALHVFTGITAVPPLIIFGTVLALLYERTGSIVPAMILHAVNNSIALAAQ